MAYPMQNALPPAVTGVEWPYPIMASTTVAK